MGRRILSLWLPDFAVERWALAGRPPGPAALIESGARGMVLSAVDAGARTLGLGEGGRLADARARCPGLVVQPHDRAGDARRQTRLADALERFTPWLAMNGPDGFLLDVTGCAHLHGGEAGLLSAVEHALARAGHGARLGLAGTIGAAWALARHAPGIAGAGAEAEALAPLPVEALRLDPFGARRLRELGLKRIGQVTGIDRASLARRFGQGETAIVRRLDQALGRVEEPLSPRRAAPEYRVMVTPLQPLIDFAGIEHEFDRLLDSLLALLDEAGRGVRRLTLTACRVDGLAIRQGIGLARAGREGGHIRRLFAEHLPGIDPGHGVDTLILGADVTEVLVPEQPGIADLGRSTPVLDRLIDRIANRLGPAASPASTFMVWMPLTMPMNVSC